jgi:PAS domain S-box-containing protein
MEAPEADVYLQSIVDTVREPLLVLDQELRVVSASRSFYRTFGVTPAETENRLLFELGNRQWDLAPLRRLLEEILLRDNAFDDFAVEHEFPGLGRRTMLLNARRLHHPDGGSGMILLSIEDVTERRRIEAALQAAYERERRVAAALQRPLTLEIAEDAFPGLAVATLYEPAGEEAIGGDFFDVFALPGGEVALALGDASGKGLAAAARSLQVREVLRAFARESPHAPAGIAARLNDYVCDNRRFDDVSDETFVCLALAILDPETGGGAVVSAGCEPPLVLRAGGAAEVIDKPCLPLGMMAGTTYVEVALHLAPGDTLILVTDGITEARRGAREFLGYEGMAALAGQALAGASSLRAAGKAILEGAGAFASGSLGDDACLLLARR